MKQLTRKDERAGAKVSPYSPIDTTFKGDVERLTKLGRLEEILRKYKINSFEELEKVIELGVVRLH